MQQRSHRHMGDDNRMNKSALIIILATAFAVSIFLNLFLYVQNRAETQADDDFALYYKEYGNVTILSRNYDFSPPVTMFRALRIALRSDDWDAAALSNMTVRVYLEYAKFGNASAGYPVNLEIFHEVTEPAESYVPVEVNGTTNRYIWSIVVDDTAFLGTFHTPPRGLYWVDVATGELIPHGPLY